ncbi:MAG TPA: EAL domain-containing protein [Burkholderiales bacterium]|jgi:EAL domain-containing protein (putative c-di-GMP-specific phosphodiesterase class I)
MSGKEFDPQLQKMDDELAGWSEPAERLRQALSKDELALYCQPIAALTGTVRFPMAEVLIRLREEEKAMLPPGEFLPVFEHYRLMPDLDRWVVRKVVQHLARGSRIPRFTINVSSQTLDDPAFPKAVALELVSAGVPGTAVHFEISEADTIARLEASIRFSTAIRAVGCGLMVSGFGRRTATFLPLKALRPDYVKVDGTIVRKLLSAPAAETKLKAILRVGEVMGFQVIGEMVEDQDILLRLKALGVGFAQGFGIQQPHPIEKLAR